MFLSFFFYSAKVRIIFIKPSICDESTEAHLGPCQPSKMELFHENNYQQKITFILAKMLQEYVR